MMGPKPLLVVTAKPLLVVTAVGEINREVGRKRGEGTNMDFSAEREGK